MLRLGEALVADDLLRVGLSQTLQHQAQKDLLEVAAHDELRQDPDGLQTQRRVDDGRKHLENVVLQHALEEDLRRLSVVVLVGTLVRPLGDEAAHVEESVQVTVRCRSGGRRPGQTVLGITPDRCQHRGGEEHVERHLRPGVDLLGRSVGGGLFVSDGGQQRGHNLSDSPFMAIPPP